MKKKMQNGVITSSIRDMNNYSADKLYLITRTKGNIIISDKVRHLKVLAPSQDLFGWYLKHRYDNNWYEHYKEQYEEDMKNSNEMNDVLNKIKLLAKTQTILLACFCKDVNTCHRGIIADELRKRGTNVLKY
jgi:uncharacterized protein YeaO (DUF488 family)